MDGFRSTGNGGHLTGSGQFDPTGYQQCVRRKNGTLVAPAPEAEYANFVADLIPVFRYPAAHLFVDTDLFNSPDDFIAGFITRRDFQLLD